jgi:hypothetical protein
MLCWLFAGERSLGSGNRQDQHQEVGDGRQWGCAAHGAAPHWTACSGGCLGCSVWRAVGSCCAGMQCGLPAALTHAWPRTGQAYSSIAQQGCCMHSSPAISRSRRQRGKGDEAVGLEHTVTQGVEAYLNARACPGGCTGAVSSLARGRAGTRTDNMAACMRSSVCTAAYSSFPSSNARLQSAVHDWC